MHSTTAQHHSLLALHLEDSDLDHLLLRRALQATGLVVQLDRAEDKASLLLSLQSKAYDIVLMDFHLPTVTATEAWEEIAKTNNPPPCVVVSGAIGEAAAVKAIQTGISDFLHKDNLQEIGRIILRAIQLHKATKERELANTNLLRSEQKITELARHLQTTLENERASIAREIHDDIGGALAAIQFDLAWITRHTENMELLAHASSAQTMVKQALIATQRIMQNTRPAILDQGLCPSVQWLARSHERRTGCSVELKCSVSETSLSDAFRLTAYRIVQESLTNISKYAPEANVYIEITDEGEVLTVEVRDSGPGFSIDEISFSTGFGLKGLTERAKNIGGWLDISSTPGVGATITLTAPLKQAMSS